MKIYRKIQENTEAARYIAWLDDLPPGMVQQDGELGVMTAIGFKTCEHGDWIVRQSDGSYYPLPDALFKLNFMEVT